MMTRNPHHNSVNHHLDIAELLSRAEIQIDLVPERRTDRQTPGLPTQRTPSAFQDNLLEDLRQAALQCQRPEIIHLLKELLPSYTPS
ncbi:MAG: hypothetical protein IT369_16110 [Candidatus Latescibacteria bacterium]|nr:hypothetical protein [Candidatus Latescibacterota bacterium]